MFGKQYPIFYHYGIIFLTIFTAFAVLFPHGASGAEFKTFREFKTYPPVELRPFRSLPKFQDQDFTTFPDAKQGKFAPLDPEFREYDDSYGDMSPPDVTLPEYNTPKYGTYSPLPQVKEGPYRPDDIPAFRPFKPMD